jgi:lysophospholipase L1-like esterase
MVGLVCLVSCKGRTGQAADAGVRALEPSGPRASEWLGGHTSPSAAAPPPVRVPREAWVLHVGDSFVDASFQQNLWPRFRAAGARYIVRERTATYTTTWANDPEFDELLSRRPALVIVTLGANEFDIEKPEQHARAIEAIARKIARSGASCAWTSPPMWTPDTGIVRVIHDHCAPCLFFDSDAVLGGMTRAERRPDRIHPNERGGARWAAAFWDWLASHRDPDAGAWGLVAFERREE